MANIEIANRSFVGLATLTMQRVSDGVIYNWPVPQSFNLATNIEIQQKETRTSQGRKSRAGSYVKGEMPELTISYTYIQPEMVGFQVGNQLATGTLDVGIPRYLEVTKNAYDGAASGFLFNGLAEDLVGVTASKLTDAGLSVSLTYSPYATFDEGVDDSFAFGADGALLFSDNLVANRDVVMLLAPATVTGNVLSETLVGTHRLYASLINDQNQVTLFKAENVTPNLEGTTIEFGGDGGMEIKLFLNNVPGSCRAWSMVETDIKVACI